MRSVMYYLALIIGAPIALIFFKFKVSYEGGKKFQIPKGAIILSGHKGGLDAIAIAYLFFFRRIYFLVADWYRGFLKIFKPFMYLLGAVFVDLKGERYDFLLSSQKLLSSGKSLLVFPEGDYKENKHLFELGQFKTGYLLIALKSGAPIVPVISDFSYGLFSRSRFKIGKPIYIQLNKTEDSLNYEVSKLNDLIRGKCLTLLQEIKREKVEDIKTQYKYQEIKSGDVIRIKEKQTYRYGIYLNPNKVVEFVNEENDQNVIKFASLSSFTKGQIPEVRILSKHTKIHSVSEIEAYIKEINNQKNYPLGKVDSLDLINRLTLKY